MAWEFEMVAGPFNPPLTEGPAAEYLPRHGVIVSLAEAALPVLHLSHWRAQRVAVALRSQIVRPIAVVTIAPEAIHSHSHSRNSRRRSRGSWSTW